MPVRLNPRPTRRLGLWLHCSEAASDQLRGTKRDWQLHLPHWMQQQRMLTVAVAKTLRRMTAGEIEVVLSVKQPTTQLQGRTAAAEQPTAAAKKQKRPPVNSWQRQIWRLVWIQVDHLQAESLSACPPYGRYWQKLWRQEQSPIEKT